ncbi:MAG: hypothetical protein V7K89_04940 [Nostoc sp.]|uniref:hypothetical protein n=1 Tax=Nostoc sp. TaxID=1180 RepID=UPI002FF76EC3
MTGKLEEAIISLAEASNFTPATAQMKTKVHEIVWQNNLDEDSAVPEWLLEFLKQIEQGKQTEWIPYPDSNYSFSDVFEVIAELDEVLPIKYEHKEESIVLTMESLDVEAVIWVESGQYQIRKIQAA